MGQQQIQRLTTELEQQRAENEQKQLDLEFLMKSLSVAEQQIKRLLIEKNALQRDLDEFVGAQNIYGRQTQRQTSLQHIADGENAMTESMPSIGANDNNQHMFSCPAVAIVEPMPPVPSSNETEPFFFTPHLSPHASHYVQLALQLQASGHDIPPSNHAAPHISYNTFGNGLSNNNNNNHPDSSQTTLHGIDIDQMTTAAIYEHAAQSSMNRSTPNDDNSSFADTESSSMASTDVDIPDDYSMRRYKREPRDTYEQNLSVNSDD